MAVAAMYIHMSKIDQCGEEIVNSLLMRNYFYPTA